MQSKFQIKTIIIKIESAVIVHDICYAAAVNNAESAVAKGGIQFFAGATGEQGYTEVGRILGKCANVQMCKCANEDEAKYIFTDE